MRICANISIDAIRHNFNEIKKRIPEGTAVMPVIKANAYGHGALTFADALKDAADYFAVATIGEAIELRKNGVKNSILVLGSMFPDTYSEAVENDIIFTVTSYNQAENISKVATELGKCARVHIALDTGMSRIGFPPSEESVEVIRRIEMLENLCVEGVFTHLSTADEEDKSFTFEQVRLFSDFRKMLGGNYLFHCGNSGAIMQHECAAFDMMRPGIILYGLYPSDEVDKSVLQLMPVMELVSHIAFIKNVEKGTPIGYGRTFKADRDMKIATIPVGYADGYPRLLSNKGRVIINEKYAPIVGRICMDQFMVDVTDIENAREGDKVTLIGSQGSLTVSADEIAHHAQTINYEVVCGISGRVPRKVTEK